jgi:hypothetical protein
MSSWSNNDLDFLPDFGFNDGLLRSLATNFRDRFVPENLPPLQLTSRPVEVGMLLNDRLAVPWYKSVFRNIGDVLSPEELPPLQLESVPVDVGELIADELAHGWWTSLLRNLADVVAPERLPALHLSSRPVELLEASPELFTPLWSHLLTGPKIYDPSTPRDMRPGGLNLGVGAVEPQPEPAVVPLEVRLVAEQMKKDIRRGHIREVLWVSCAVTEIAFLVFYFMH